MAITVSLYNHTKQRFAAGLNAAADTYKLQLLNNSATFDATHTALTSVNGAGAYEVSGNGWDVGGEPLANVVIAIKNVNDAMFDADNLSVTATGGAIGPAYKAVLYNDTDANDPPVAFIDFGEAKTADENTPFLVEWNAAGIVEWVDAGD